MSTTQQTTPEVMLGRYHARAVELIELNRRRIEAGQNLTAARKEMKKIKANTPGKDADDAERAAWESKIGRQSIEIDRATATKVSAELALNAHIGNKALPLFKAAPEEVAEDCIRGGIMLLLETHVDAADIREKFEMLLDVARYLFAVDQPPKDEDDGQDGQGSLFVEPEKRERGSRERSLAWLLRGTHRPPSGFSWLEIVAHLSDVELDEAWRWAAAPHKHESPACLAAVFEGKSDGFTRDPGLPVTMALTDLAVARFGKRFTIDIDDAGHIVAMPEKEVAQQVGQIDTAQMRIPTFVALRLVTAADPRWKDLTRDDFTWRGREPAGPREAPLKAGPPPCEVEKNPKLEDTSADKIREALAEHQGDLAAAGRQLGYGRDALRRRCTYYGIDVEGYRKS